MFRQALNQRPQHEMTEMINVINSAVESGLIDKNGEIVEEGNNSVDSDDDWDPSMLDSDSYDDSCDDNQVENSEDEQPTVTEDDKRTTYSICKKGMDSEEINQIPDKEKMVITFKGNVHETKWVFRRLGLGGRYHPTSVQYEYIQQITMTRNGEAERFETNWMQRKNLFRVGTVIKTTVSLALEY